MGLHVLQIGALVPTVPPGLGAAITVIGLTVMIGAHMRILMARLDRQSRENYGVRLEHRKLAGWAFGSGILFVTIGALQRYQLVVLYIAVLYFVGSMITGVAHVRFWKKAELLLRKREYSGNLARTIKYGLLSVFVIVAIGSLFVELVLSAPFDSPIEVQFALVWTLLVLGLSIVGLSKRILPLRQQLDDQLVYGYILTIAGTEIFDLTLPLEFGFLFIGMAGYGFGFWLAVYYWLWG